MSRFIAYYRVSTAKQGRSGLGLEAQQSAVARYVGSGKLLAEYTEVESGKRDDRQQLQAALQHAKLTGATLLVAKLDRLSRNVAFLAALQDSGAKFIAVDNPEANELTIHILAAVAQAERKAISQRTKDALQAAKARGRSLGGKRANQRPVSAVERQRAIQVVQARAADYRASVLPIAEQARAAGHTTLQAIAAYLNAQHIASPRGGKWHPASVARLLG